MAMRDFADIYTQTLWAAGPRDKGVYISKSCCIHDTTITYHSGHTHLIGERTTDHSPHLFYALASDD